MPFSPKPPPEARSRIAKIKQMVRQALEDRDTLLNSVIHWFLIVVVLLSILVLILEVEPNPDPEFKTFLDGSETVFSTIFLLEYLLRWWVCSDLFHDYHYALQRLVRRQHRVRRRMQIWFALRYCLGAKWRWMRQPLSIVDLLAVLPIFYTFRVFRILRVLRLLKLLRYSQRMSVMGGIIQAQAEDLRAFFIVTLLMWGTVSIAFYVVERGVNPHIHNLWDAFYWTVVTVATLGYGDITPLTTTGRAVAIIGVLFGMATTIFLTSIIVAALTERLFFLRENRMERRIADLQDYYIVCGLGRLGRAVCTALNSEHKPFVGIDNLPPRVNDAVQAGWMAIQGDVTEETTWDRLSLDRVKGVIITLSEEASSIFAILMVKDRNPDCLIVANGPHPNSERRLLRVGANRVISPTQIGGTQMAYTVLRPSATQLLNLVLKRDYLELEFEEVPIAPNTLFDGSTISGSRVRNAFNVIVVGIVPKDGQIHFNPSASSPIGAGDTLICLGHVDDLERLRQAAQQLVAS